jgi:CRISPR-associated protein Csb2
LCDVRATHLSGEAVHYLYPLPPEGCPHLEVLKAAARSITHLGWGIDMVASVADVIAEAVADRLPGQRWRKVKTSWVPLRVPKEGTLADLICKHAGFLGRLSGEGFKPVPLQSCFAIRNYANIETFTKSIQAGPAAVVLRDRGVPRGIGIEIGSLRGECANRIALKINFGHASTTMESIHRLC